MSRPPLRVWRFGDGKPGHDSQSRGLLAALQRRVPLQVREVPVPWPWRSLLGRLPLPPDAPPPDLLLGAGHASHRPLLQARRRHGGRAVVLMRPSLPAAWFDLCLVPEHDGAQPSAHVLPTRGVLNAVQAVAGPRDGSGLLLVGGPSRHHAWDGDDLLAQVAAVVDAEPDRPWTLTTSRRTPAAFVDRVRALQRAQLEVLPVGETAPGWLAGRVARAEVAWVSEDSVSMIFEALTGGARVGLLALPPLGGTGRVLRGLDSLLQAGWVATYAQWLQHGTLPPARAGFNEAERCADLLLERWWPAA